MTKLGLHLAGPGTLAPLLIAALLTIHACGDSSSPPDPTIDEPAWELRVRDTEGNRASASFSFFANILATVTRAADGQLVVRLEDVQLGGDLQVRNETADEIRAEIFSDGELVGSAGIESNGSWFFGLARNAEMEVMP